MRKYVCVAVVAAALALAGCTSTADLPAAQVGSSSAAPDSTFDPTPEDPATPTQEPAAVETPPAPAQQPTLTITFLGTDATFTWTDASGMHQVQQSGPYEVKMPFHVGMNLNANSVSFKKDAGCKVTVTGDTGNVSTIVDNTMAGQSMASCVKVRVLG